MKAIELFADNDEHPSYEFFKLGQCTQFLEQSEGHPLLKNILTEDFSWFRTVKIRHHKKVTPFIESFNEAFANKFGIQKVHQRAIFANGERSHKQQNGTGSYYVFPINEFKFIYNTEVTSTSKYQSTFEQLHETISDEEAVKSIVADLLGYTYVSENLCEGIESGAEIVMFGIPFYYAVDKNAYPDYNELYSLLT